MHSPRQERQEKQSEKDSDSPLNLCLTFSSAKRAVTPKDISREEALAILDQAEEIGLVHTVSNVAEGIGYVCNCCGCCCWSVGTINRRRIPRDVLMATYFIRETERDSCVGCGQCVDICPVDAIAMEGDYPAVDNEWCIGCGVCLRPCPTSAATLKRKTPEVPPSDFGELHTRILTERGLK